MHALIALVIAASLMAWNAGFAPTQSTYNQPNIVEQPDDVSGPAC